jgi:phosphatidate cytidylyltransferase
MAFNIATFKTRSLTAAVFVVVMMAGLLWNHWSFFLLFSIVHFGCWIEYQKLVGLIDKEYVQISSFHKYSVMLAGWCMLIYFTNDSFNFLGIRLHAIGWWLGLLFLFLLPIIELLFAKQMRLKNIAHSFFGLLYISLPWALMIDLGMTYTREGGLEKSARGIIPLILIGSIWINDTMAYIVGSLIGKTPFSKISPKKTWEGTIGGAVLCVAVMGLLGWWIGYYPVKDWLIIAGIAAIAGTAGDLFESKLKRLAGVKDSGSLMPGHGGFLDRFDSLLFATPPVWGYVVLFIK